MNEGKDNIIARITKLGLEQDEVKVYLYLLGKGERSVSKLSKELELGRNVIYRIIDILVKKKLVVEVLKNHGKNYKAESYENLKFLVSEQEQKVKSLKEGLPEIFHSLSLITGQNIVKSEIKYYSGRRGLKQITWNSTKAKDDLRIFELYKMVNFIDDKTAEDFRLEFSKNQVNVKQLSNVKEFSEWTNITEFVEKYWRCRYIAPEDLTMESEFLVYNDVYALYSFTDNDVFGVEIYSEKLARMQKQIFDFMWKGAKELKILNERGTARLDD